VKLPLLGDSTLRLFGAYRYRVWNGSLGEEDVYSAYGVSLEDTGVLPNWGRLSSNYFWRLGMGSYQANAFQTTTLADLWRTNAIGSLNLSLPLWTGKPAPLTATEAYQNTAIPVVPGLALNANLLGTLAYYGDGRNQNTISLSGGPTLTLGRFVKPFLDFTRLTITGSITARQGLSPLSFDSAVDLAPSASASPSRSWGRWCSTAASASTSTQVRSSTATSPPPTSSCAGSGAPTRSASSTARTTAWAG
jgi:hypothetical protein